MITIEQIETALGEDATPFKTKNVDHDFVAIKLLREKIPYDICKDIIGGAGHDIIYLCDVDQALPYLTEEDLLILADCNCFIDSDTDSIALFV